MVNAFVHRIMRASMAHPKHLYDTARWRYRTRKQALLNANYRCAKCNEDLHYTSRAHVHHIIATEYAPGLMYDLFNLEVLCRDCHNREHDRGSLGCDVNGSPLDPDHPWNTTE
jgi:5-methylcytosine-specific restriction endonuclease McrA